MSKQNNRLPGWLKTKIYPGKGYKKVNELLLQTGLHTICIEARCPNRCECFSNKEVTFLIGGKTCTRNCKYCNVETETKIPTPLDLNEPDKIAKAVKELQLKYVVITSVTRDDIDDGCAEHFYKTAKEILNQNPNVKVELLIPDFCGDMHCVEKICSSGAVVIGHNIEICGRRNFQFLRPGADYSVSLNILSEISKNIDKCKSGFMVGFGETKKDIKNTLSDLKSVGVNIITVGQYLAPSKDHFPVLKYYKPKEFKKIEKLALNMGFEFVKAGPFVRSSYRAGEIFE